MDPIFMSREYPLGVASGASHERRRAFSPSIFVMVRFLGAREGGGGEVGFPLHPSKKIAMKAMRRARAEIRRVMNT